MSGSCSPHASQIHHFSAIYQQKAVPHWCQFGHSTLSFYLNLLEPPYIQPPLSFTHNPGQNIKFPDQEISCHSHLKEKREPWPKYLIKLVIFMMVELKDESVTLTLPLWRSKNMETALPTENTFPRGVSILLLTSNTSDEARLHFSLAPDILIIAIVLLRVD